MEICKYYAKVNLCANKLKLCTLLVGCGEFMRREYRKKLNLAHFLRKGRLAFLFGTGFGIVLE